MKKNILSFMLKLLLAGLIETVLYIFLHEGGHALVAISCGSEVTAFSITRAFVSSVGGNYTPDGIITEYCRDGIAADYFRMLYAVSLP